MRESEWNVGNAAAVLAPLARDPATWLAQSRRVRGAARPEAADAVAAIVLEESRIDPRPPA